MYIEQIIHDNEMNELRKSPHSSSAWFRMILGSSWLCCMVASPSNSLDSSSFVAGRFSLEYSRYVYFNFFVTRVKLGAMVAFSVNSFALFYLKTKYKNSFKGLINKRAVFDLNYLTLYCKSKTLPCIRLLAQGLA